jgi:membrane-anchored mycosin MYCP
VSQTSVVQGDGQTAEQPPQIVVNTLHRRLVEDALHEEFSIQVTRAEADAALDLTLLDLEPEHVLAVTNDRATALDEVFAGLYRRFEADFGRWVPTFGKNRELQQVVSQHTIDGGDEGAPTRPGSASSWPARRSSPGAGVQVAVADTAVAPRPQLVGSILADADALIPERDPSPDAAPLPSEAGHGTFVTGLVLRAAPGATVRAVRVLNDRGVSDSWELAKAMVTLARHGVDVLNLSLGCFTDDDQAPLVLARALSRLGPDVLVVAAAGNHGKTTDAKRPLWPGAFDAVVAVGATDESGVRQAWSPDPQFCPWVDVQACGADVESVFLEGKVLTALKVKSPGEKPAVEDFDGFAQWSGTSFAAARVSGMIAAATVPGRVRASEALEGLLGGAAQQDYRPWLR